MRHTLLLSLCLLAATLSAVPQPSKKLIHFGWNEPHLLGEYQKGTLEQLAGKVPFDGIGFRPLYELKRNGQTIRYKLGRPPKTGLIKLEKDDFKDWIVQFRRLKDNTRLKYNFFDLSTCLFSPNWFDDKAWELTMNNFTIMAWLAKESGFAGLGLDIEAYSFCGFPFAFDTKYGHTYEETAAQIRKRAKQWIEGITAEFPDMALHCCFWSSMCQNADKARHPISTGKYAFIVPFFNGVYDGAPETMTIHDGVESQGYHASGEQAFAQVVADYYRFAPAWIAPENMAKYRKITRLSIGHYLDSYIPRPNPGNWKLFATTDNPTRLLYENTKLALEYSDEYAWYQCEHGTFWPEINGSKNDPVYWNERLPYLREALDAAASPTRFCAQNLGPALNMNPQLTPAANYKPVPYNKNIANWSVWHEENNSAGEGIIYMEDGGVRFKKCANAAISQGTYKNFKPGETYLLTARAKTQGSEMVAYINEFFRDKDGNGLWHLRKNAYFEQDEPDGWKRATLIFKVPDMELSQMAICVSVSGHGKFTPDSDPGILVDDVQLHKVDFPTLTPANAAPKNAKDPAK